jgi:hypothetical protein
MRSTLGMHLERRGRRAAGMIAGEYGNGTAATGRSENFMKVEIVSCPT